MLHNLSTSLAAIQQGTHEEYLSKRHELESARDYELTRLRLWEEYQVKRVETEYKEDIAVAKQTYDMMVKLLKEKFYDKLQRQVKQLKEDKLLLNLINASSWSPNGNDATVSALSAAAAASSLTLHDRRSLRKRDLHSRFASGEADDLSESNMSGGSGLRTGSGSAGYISASGKRRRHYATRYSSNDESSGVGGANGMKSAGTASSGNDSNLSDKDYDALNQMIMNNDEGVPSMFGARPRPARGSHKQFVGVQGLRPEELNSDLTLLRNAVKRER
ncbi:putative transcriptional regulatory protein [Clavispora lusitaniae]|uniref:Transcriptional regulatory protein n=1 Tax=Clavispora lusitaniae TaxID=36911 RepID=A0ACD0WND9_CLALS|nr:putative transcriptional regulatory protein [Clavispora lusitaniae]QFZ34506.1 putative transcriptional regulatory protein [Clavispora lusitaniae]QFZ40191.1 putative transcriptional regulatory protein [Clavispora lusitaniae]QFZ45871.1 putative transcriptional regulatory protein [Clavispora lusitaniae]QFZ51533.1 putative transcriptional regulatory protein [Clavispora lusitaniae]